MRRLGVVVLAVLLVAGCQASSNEKTAKPDPTITLPSESPTDQASTDPIIHTNPNVEYSHSCTYLLGNFTQSSRGFRFIARAGLHNTGNVGVVVAVKASWVQVGSHNVVKSKTVHLPYGARHVVNLSQVVSQSQIDQIQATNGTDCHVKATMLQTFGAPHA